MSMMNSRRFTHDGANVQRGFANTADAFNKDIEPPTLVFEGK
jgi:hypothetical protein